MSSLKARLFCFMLRNRHLLKLQLKKTHVDWDTYEAILGFRQDVEQGAETLGKLPEGMEVSPVTAGKVPGEWILPAQDYKKDKVMLYFHGGGYVSGTCRAHRAITAKFVQGSNTPALLFEYSLAPEHPFPAALNESIAAYQWLLDQGILPSNIVFMGDSAGGGLCLGTLLALKDQSIILPAAAVVLSPMTDCKCTGESHKTYAKVCLSPEGTAPAFARHYAGENDLGLPYISPLYGDLQGLPPLLIYAGGKETLLDDSVRFAEKAGDAGVEVTLRVGEGLFHCYPACSPLFPEAEEAMNDICSFISKHLPS